MAFIPKPFNQATQAQNVSQLARIQAGEFQQSDYQAFLAAKANPFDLASPNIIPATSKFGIGSIPKFVAPSFLNLPNYSPVPLSGAAADAVTPGTFNIAGTTQDFRNEGSFLSNPVTDYIFKKGKELGPEKSIPLLGALAFGGGALLGGAAGAAGAGAGAALPAEFIGIGGGTAGGGAAAAGFGAAAGGEFALGGAGAAASGATALDLGFVGAGGAGATGAGGAGAITSAGAGTPILPPTGGGGFLASLKSNPLFNVAGLAASQLAGSKGQADIAEQVNQANQAAYQEYLGARESGLAQAQGSYEDYLGLTQKTYQDFLDVSQTAYQDYLDVINPPEDVKATRFNQLRGQVLSAVPTARRRLSDTLASRGIRGQGAAAPIAGQDQAVQDAINQAYFQIYGNFNVPSGPFRPPAPPAVPLPPELSAAGSNFLGPGTSPPVGVTPSTGQFAGKNISDLASVYFLNQLINQG